MYLNAIASVILLSSCVAAQSYKDLRTVLEYKSLEYEFPSDNDRQYAIDNGFYKQNAGAPIEIAVEYKRNGSMRIFQTIPRFGDGVPFTLATVTKRSTQNGPILTAYPNYNWHNVNNAGCKGITSAFRIVIDECKHMWVIDSGVVNDVQICPPQLLTFDLRTDSLLSRFQFPPNLYTSSKSLMISLAVDIRDPPPLGSCRNAMVYVADVQRGGLVVYSTERNLAWRIEDELMLPRYPWGTHTVAGETFELMDGIFALNLSPRGDRNRYLFFHAYADDREVAVPLRYLDNPMSAFNKRSSLFQVLGSRGVQSAMETIDSKGNMFTSTDDPLSIFVWNINTPYNKTSFRVVANNPDQLQVVSGMKVVKNPFGLEQLWVSACRFQKLATDSINNLEVNFRVSFCLTEDLLRNGRCTDTRNEKWTDLIYENHVSTQKWAKRGHK